MALTLCVLTLFCIIMRMISKTTGIIALFILLAMLVWYRIMISRVLKKYTNNTSGTIVSYVLGPFKMYHQFNADVTYTYLISGYFALCLYYICNLYKGDASGILALVGSDALLLIFGAINSFASISYYKSLEKRFHRPEGYWKKWLFLHPIAMHELVSNDFEQEDVWPENANPTSNYISTQSPETKKDNWADDYLALKIIQEEESHKG